MNKVGDKLEKIKNKLLKYNELKERVKIENEGYNSSIEEINKKRDIIINKKADPEKNIKPIKDKGTITKNLKLTRNDYMKKIEKNNKNLEKEENKITTYIKDFLNPHNDNNIIDDYYLFLSDLSTELNKEKNKKTFINGESFKEWFLNKFTDHINNIFGSGSGLSKLRNDSIGKNMDNISLFGDLYLRVQEEDSRAKDKNEINKVRDEYNNKIDEAYNKGKEEVYKKTYNAAKEIPEIKESVKEIKETINPEPKNKEGYYSPMLLLRNNQYLNKIHEYISRGYGDLSREELIKKLKYIYKNDEDAKAFADAILIRKTEQQKRFEPVYKRLRDIRDANLLQRLPEDVQKGINDYEREQYAIKSRDVENYYLLPHEWKRLKAARDYGINPMLLRGIIKE